jgi:hypothetical protein
VSKRSKRRQGGHAAGGPETGGRGAPEGSGRGASEASGRRAPEASGRRAPEASGRRAPEASGRAVTRAASGHPASARPAASGWGLGVQIAFLVAVFAVTVLVAELAGAANLGVAFGVGSIAFAIAVVYLLVRR